MSLRPEPLPPFPRRPRRQCVPPFPKSTLYVDLRAEFGTLYADQLFTDLYPPAGRPVEVRPGAWRWSWSCNIWKGSPTARPPMPCAAAWIGYALSLDLHDPGFDFTLLHDFRERLLAHDATQRFLDTFLTACKARMDQGARHPTDRFDACAGGYSYAQPP